LNGQFIAVHFEKHAGGGTFNDPNVLGAFLVLPSLLALQALLAGRRVARNALALLIMLVGLFLTFSRGAWGQLAFAAALLMALTYITSRSASERARAWSKATISAAPSWLTRRLSSSPMRRRPCAH
jgi:hypothetical protein